jgi:mRNA-degrading endonuclease toxin of MazEF toxin-antitoxin module
MRDDWIEQALRLLLLADLSRTRRTEPGKVRPVVVVQTDLLNEVGHPSTRVLPCTTRLTGGRASSALCYRADSPETPRPARS